MGESAICSEIILGRGPNAREHESVMLLQHPGNFVPCLLGIDADHPGQGIGIPLRPEMMCPDPGGMPLIESAEKLGGRLRMERGNRPETDDVGDFLLGQSRGKQYRRQHHGRDEPCREQALEPAGRTCCGSLRAQKLGVFRRRAHVLDDVPELLHRPAPRLELGVASLQVRIHLLQDLAAARVLDAGERLPHFPQVPGFQLLPTLVLALHFLFPPLVTKSILATSSFQCSFIRRTIC